MSENGDNPTAALVEIIRAQDRWPSVAQPLLAANESKIWQREGFPTFSAWLDHLAALGGRSTTYLSRCVSAARFLTELKKNHPDADVGPVWSRSLSDIEAFRRKMNDDDKAIVHHLADLATGKITAYTLRLEEKRLGATPGRAQRIWIERAFLDGLDELLPEMGYPPLTKVFIEPHTPFGRPDVVLVEPDSGVTTIIEIKSNLSSRRLTDMLQQLLAYASLGQKVWLVLPSDSELPGQTIIDSLKTTAITHVGVVLLDPASGKVVQQIPPQDVAADEASRQAFRTLVTSTNRPEA